MNIDLKEVPVDAKAAFLNLACVLSPEASYSETQSEEQVRARRVQAKSEWILLEEMYGVTVTEQMTHGWYDEVNEWSQSIHVEKWKEIALDSGMDDRLFAVWELGVWQRKGKDDSQNLLMSPYRIVKRPTIMTETGECAGDQDFRVECSLAPAVGEPYIVGWSSDLTEAANMGDAFLRNITQEAVRLKNPQWSEDTIKSMMSLIPETTDITSST